MKPTQNTRTDTDNCPQYGGKWIRRKGANTIIFVHGILSNGEFCWTHNDGTYWPALIRDDPRFDQFGILVFSYRCDAASGTYSISDVADSLRTELHELLTEKCRLVFVCHSMGGIVVRRFLVREQAKLIEKKADVNLFLVASPSLGSQYADWLSSVVRSSGNTQFDSLRFNQCNTWLNDLDKDFRSLKESHRLSIKGQEIIEDEGFLRRTVARVLLIKVLSILKLTPALRYLVQYLERFMNTQIVEEFSAARYFGNSVKIPGSNHKSIAKPDSPESLQHRLLCIFLLDCLGAPSRFWPELSDEIIILYGFVGNDGSKYTTTISMRDTDAVDRICDYLKGTLRKTVHQIRVGREGWRQKVTDLKSADVVIVGGFAANSAYDSRQYGHDQTFRLKIGRVCSIGGRRVYHTTVKNSGADGSTSHSDFQAFDSLPAEFITKDHALVTRSCIEAFGVNRCVITVAGTRGIGTLGAAQAIAGNSPCQVDTLLRSTVSRNDSIGIIVRVDATKGHVDRTEVMEFLVNHEYMTNRMQEFSQICELANDCESCQHGLLVKRDPRELANLAPRIDTVILDLDDTLIDTFGMLITPLERKAAQEMLRMGLCTVDEETLVDTLLRLRKTNPENIEYEIQRQFTPCPEEALEARRKVFQTAYPDGLFIRESARIVLQELTNRYTTHLVTTGHPQFQHAKLALLKLRNLFHNITVLDSGNNETKESWMRSLERSHIRPRSTVVVGNRLDDEIQAANAFGFLTIWVKHGEGSELTPSCSPHYIIDSIETLPGLLRKIDSR